MESGCSAALGCVIMAAGNASRFGRNKLESELDGRTLITRALDAVPAEMFRRVTVVSQYPAILRMAGDRGFDAVLNDRPEDGVSRTIRLGTERMAECAAILYMVADQPLLRADTVRRVARAWLDDPGCIAAASSGGRRGNPCIFPARLFPELLALTGDRGGSAVIRAHPELLRLVEAEARELVDCDTPDALRELAQGSPRG